MKIAVIAIVILLAISWYLSPARTQLIATRQQSSTLLERCQQRPLGHC